MLWISFVFILGLAALILGAHLLVKGASQLALTLKISPLVIGLTIVSFGTSAPEIAVSSLASWRGNAELVLGNIIGSNIFNVLLVLGLSATISPLVVTRKLIWWDIPLMIVISFAVWLLAMTGSLNRWEGIGLLVALTLYTVLTYRFGSKERGREEATHPLWKQILFISAGLLLLAGGSESIVTSSQIIARALGVSDLFIGLTLVAVGTSLPEIATSLTATFRGERDLAVGNVVGSNIFNLLAVLGISLLVSPGSLPVPRAALTLDFPVMIATAIACLPVFLTGHKISRWEGILFLAYYFFYIVYLYLAATENPILETFTAALLFFVIPLTILTLVISLVRHYRVSK